jgi:hypothetical protein
MSIRKNQQHSYIMTADSSIRMCVLLGIIMFLFSNVGSGPASKEYQGVNTLVTVFSTLLNLNLLYSLSRTLRRGFTGNCLLRNGWAQAHSTLLLHGTEIEGYSITLDRTGWRRLPICFNVFSMRMATLLDCPITRVPHTPLHSRP